MKAIVTAYCACVICCGKADGLTASGTIPRVGVTVAAPRSVPFGTMVTIDVPGIGRIRRRVEDRTARRYGHRWDVYVHRHTEAKEFGKRNCTITIHE